MEGFAQPILKYIIIVIMYSKSFSTLKDQKVKAIQLINIKIPVCLITVSVTLVSSLGQIPDTQNEGGQVHVAHSHWRFQSALSLAPRQSGTGQRAAGSSWRWSSSGDHKSLSLLRYIQALSLRLGVALTPIIPVVHELTSNSPPHDCMRLGDAGDSQTQPITDRI